MPDRELRRMRRAELVEIILALKQTEDRLRAENAALSAQLQERQIHIENAGSIAQAALELNNVFAAAQAAADDYLHSVQASLADTNATAANRHMIDANAIAKMKNGVVLINTARGTLIDPEALINGLESGKIGAAGLDVVENENGLFYFNHMGDALQNRELAMLRSFPNVIFTPHTAFYTDVNVASMVESAFKAVRAMADGEQTPLEVHLSLIHI